MKIIITGSSCLAFICGVTRYRRDCLITNSILSMTVCEKCSKHEEYHSCSSCNEHLSSALIPFILALMRPDPVTQWYIANVSFVGKYMGVMLRFMFVISVLSY